MRPAVVSLSDVVSDPVSGRSRSKRSISSTCSSVSAMSSRPVQQPLPDLGVDLERYIAAVERDDLALEVDGRLVRLHQRPHLLLRQRDGSTPILVQLA